MAYTTIDDPELYFQNKIYSGDGNDDRSITLDGSENMQPDMVWLAERNTTSGHAIHDSARGVDKFMFPYTTTAEGTSTARVKSFDSNGFTVGTSGATNGSSDTYVAWCWKESATAGFDMVTYTGTGSARTIAHNLGAVPKWIICKSRSDATRWDVYHASIGATKHMRLNTTDAERTSSAVFNNTEPTSSVFSLGNGAAVNASSETFIAYLFSEIKGYSKFGSYTGNGNASGPYIYTGHKPAMIIIKRTDVAKNWYINDNLREGYNNDNPYISPNLSVAETGGTEIDILSNGFRITASGTGHNQSGGTYIFMSIAENPLVTSTGVPATAR